jgi:putative ABC transport system permease protein
MISRLTGLVEGMLIALDALRANRVRAALTILGVAIGVLSVVVMSAAINGINRAVAAEIESAGPTTFSIFRFPIDFQGGGDDERPAWASNPPIRMAEVHALERLPSLQGVSAAANTRLPVRWRDHALSSTRVRAVSGSWLETANGDVLAGRSFTPTEDAKAARVVIVNDVMIDRLFGGGDPIGKVITIAGSPFEVIGTYLDRTSWFSDGQMPLAIVPYESAHRHLNVRDDWLEVNVKPRREVPRDQAIDDVTALLRGARGLRPGQDNDFAVITQDMMFQRYQQVTSAFYLIMLALSGIGLLVGGVGVVAIMMISVTERTREIGIRKALGATRRTILWQFLVEAATLTAVGATAGLLAGAGIAWLISTLSPFQATIPPGAIIAALLASVLTGVFFGMYPAAKAARLDPIEALRYE